MKFLTTLLQLAVLTAANPVTKPPHCPTITRKVTPQGCIPIITVTPTTSGAVPTTVRCLENPCLVNTPVKVPCGCPVQVPTKTVTGRCTCRAGCETLGTPVYPTCVSTLAAM